MTDEQLRILCATIMCAVSYASEADCVSISETTAVEWTDQIIDVARASSPPALTFANEYNTLLRERDALIAARDDVSLANARLLDAAARASSPSAAADVAVSAVDGGQGNYSYSASFMAPFAEWGEPVEIEWGGGGPTVHTASPDCLCAVCLKRDARRFRAIGKTFSSAYWMREIHDADTTIAAEDAKEQSK